MSRKWLMWTMCGAMLLSAGYFLLTRGFQNILAYAPMLLCPLMHVLLMGGLFRSGRGPACHGGGGQGAGPARSGDSPAA